MTTLLSLGEPRGGTFWRQMLLLLRLLDLEPPPQAPGAGQAGEEGQEEEEFDDDEEEEAAAATDAVEEEGQLPSAAVLQAAARRLAFRRRRQLAARILLALHRMQARQRLFEAFVMPLLECIDKHAQLGVGSSAAEHRGLTGTMLLRQVGVARPPRPSSAGRLPLLGRQPAGRRLPACAAACARGRCQGRGQAPSSLLPRHSLPAHRAPTAPPTPSFHTWCSAALKR